MDWMSSLVEDGGECGQVNPAVDLAAQFTNPELAALPTFNSQQQQQNGAASTSSYVPEATFEMQKILEHMKQLKVQNSASTATTTADVQREDELSKVLVEPETGEAIFDEQAMAWAKEFEEQQQQQTSTASKQQQQSYPFRQTSDFRSKTQNLSSNPQNRFEFQQNVNPVFDIMADYKIEQQKEEMLMKMLMDTVNSTESSEFDVENLKNLAQNNTESSANIYSDTAEVKEEESDYNQEYEIWARIAEDLRASSADSANAEMEFLEQNKNPIYESFDKLMSQSHRDFYNFVEYNPFVAELSSSVQEHKSPEEKEAEVENFLQAGLERMKVGDISGAVLFFEAAAITQPKNVRAWLELGKAQSKNENDRKAISALKHCLALEQGNLTGLMSLAICYTNETMTNEACDALKEWMVRNSKYSALIQAQLDEMPPEAAPEQYQGPTPLWKRWQQKNVFSSKLFDAVSQAYIEAATQNAQSIDPDVQVGLGVLYSLNGKFLMAADCWRTAVQLRQDDHTLWNRLGATLANGGEPEAAVDAYRQALSLYPGYVRARYNLAVSCVLMGAHHEAIQHLLTILNHQTEGNRNAMASISERSNLAQILDNPSRLTSHTVWNTLTSALIQIDRDDLVQVIRDRDLVRLNREMDFRLHETGSPVE